MAPPIPTCILVFKRHREQPDNVLFIDASNYYGKATNQNNLRDEDIVRIMEAVEKRVEIEKFAYVTTLGEIKENDFNLNISRYVDTFEEEEVVDLVDVAKQLRALEINMVDMDKTIAGFCDELGVDVPFEDIK